MCPGDGAPGCAGVLQESVSAFTSASAFGSLGFLVRAMGRDFPWGPNGPLAVLGSHWSHLLFALNFIFSLCLSWHMVAVPICGNLCEVVLTHVYIVYSSSHDS